MGEMNTEELKRKLSRNAMRGNWPEVVSLCSQYPEAPTIEITYAHETVLHLAVSDNQEDIVGELLDIIRGRSDVLEKRDDRGNTALHYAAAVGSVRMCGSIARRASSLVGARNLDRETPLFLAAFHGKKNAFLCLHHLSGDGNDYSYCRRKDGQTILHSAIYGDYFDLAFQIIHLYGDLVYCVNEQGYSPLHLLATKPDAFKSGTLLGSWRSILYHCIFVDQLEVEPPECGALLEDQFTKSNDVHCPDNYKTTLLFFQIIKQMVQVATTVRKRGARDTENPEIKENQPADPELSNRDQRHKLMMPPNYVAFFEFIKCVSKALLVILGLGSTEINKIRQTKEKNTWAIQIMDELLEKSKLYEHNDNGGVNPHTSKDKEEETLPYKVGEGGHVTFSDDIEKDNSDRKPQELMTKFTPNEMSPEEMPKGETPFLTAVKYGITEMVERILENFPGATHDMNSEKKNVVLLAVENRQPHVYLLLIRRKILKDNIFRVVDRNGNSALHLAAMLGDYKPWLIPGAALQMQWELKWFEFVKSSMPPHFFVRYNHAGKTADHIFSETHTNLVKSGGEWLTNTSESCSLVAALIATVAFATSATVPGGVNENTGIPTLVDEPGFDVFAISSLIALCFSVTSVVLFLSILTSRYQQKDFEKDLPRQLLVGLSSLFVSIASMLVSFCAGHFLVLKDKLKHAAYPVYAVTCLPVTLFAIAQFPLYFDLFRATMKKVPQRSCK